MLIFYDRFLPEIAEGQFVLLEGKHKPKNQCINEAFQAFVKSEQN